MWAAAWQDAEAAAPAGDADMKDAAGEPAAPSADDTGAAPMEAEETVMQKKKRAVKKSVPVEAKTLCISDKVVLVSACDVAAAVGCTHYIHWIGHEVLHYARRAILC